MQTCSRCNHRNRDGILLCERCGTPLSEWIALSTHKMVANTPEWNANFEFKPVTNDCAEDGKITLRLQDINEPIVFDTKSEVVLGRVGVHTVRRPDIDLSSYDAFRKGVSSLHAIIYRIERYTYVADMGSLNGTYLNREVLTPHIRYLLHTGDVIHLGELAMRVFF